MPFETQHFPRALFFSTQSSCLRQSPADYLPLFFTLSVIIFIITQVSRDNGAGGGRGEGGSLAAPPPPNAVANNKIAINNGIFRIDPGGIRSRGHEGVIVAGRAST